jgi:4-hydroxyphenylpyruvate dioxygenase
MDNLEVPTPPNSQKPGKAENLDNPLGLDGLEFIEFSSNKPEELEKLFLKFGFAKIGQHKRKNVGLYRQNQVNFIINNEPGTFAAKFAKGHGPSICATGFRVKNAQKAFDAAVARGARPIDIKADSSSHSFPAVYGIGDSAIYFIDRYKDRVHYDEDFRYLQSDRHPKGKQILLIDHLTNNVPRGDMQKWCDFYREIFNFREVRDFEIKGQTTGLISRVMRSPCNKITIPINEPLDKKSQIQEYLDEYNGSGIQHIAFATNDIVTTVTQLNDEKIAFLETPDTYYETVMERLPELTESVQTLKKLGILVDGDHDGYLLQIFTKNMVGPIFFEIIQRKGHDGFGNGNFQALFDAIERDQKLRGFL